MCSAFVDEGVVALSSLRVVNSPSSPASGVLELARHVVLSQAILRLRPSEAIVCESRESSEGHLDEACCGNDEANVRQSVVNYKSLRNIRERSREAIRAQDATTVERAEHEEVRELERREEVADSRLVDLDRERRSLIRTIESLVTHGTDEVIDRAEEAVGSPLAGDNPW